MKFKFSRCVAVQVPEIGTAKSFYTDILGLSVDDLSDGYELSPGDGRLFLMESKDIPGPVLEFIVDDVEAAKDHLLNHGCIVVRWHGAGKDCYIKDPNGVIFNLWEEK